MDDVRGILQAIESQEAQENLNIPKKKTTHLSDKSGVKKPIVIGLCISIAVIILCTLGVAAYNIYGYKKIYRGVRAGDLSLSGKTIEEALVIAENFFAAGIRATDFNIQIGDNIYTINMGSNVYIDTKKTIESAYDYGRSGGPLSRLSAILDSYNNGAYIEPLYALNEQALRAQVEKITEVVNETIDEAGYTFENNVLTIDKGQCGKTLDSAALLEHLRAQLLLGDFSDTSFPLSEDEPDMVDLAVIKNEIEQEAQNPMLDLVADPSGNTVIPAQVGIYMDINQAKDIINASSERYVQIPLQIVEPTHTTEEFKALLFRDVLGQGSSNYNAGQTGRTTNVRLASTACNEVILNPGEVFSFNDTVGPRTYERGFKDATIYVGNETEEGVGGGICQVSSTIYYATLRADLEIVERKCHSRMVTYVPLGEDATVAWGYIDYRFKNNTEYPIKLEVTSGNSKVSVKIIGTQTTANKEVKISTKTLSHTPFETQRVIDSTLPVGTEKVDSNGYTGYKTESYRVVYINGVEVSRTFENSSTYTKYDKIINYNPGEGIVDPVTGDPAGGDPVTGDPVGGDPVGGDPIGGEDTSGDGGDIIGGSPDSGDTSEELPFQPQKDPDTSHRPGQSTDDTDAGQDENTGYHNDNYNDSDD